MNKKYFVNAGGGLGDFIKAYFTTNKWKILSEIKKYEPNSNILAVLTTHHYDAGQLICTHPAIDEILIYPWYPPGHSKEYLWKQLIVGRNTNTVTQYTPTENNVWLTDSEQEVFKKLTEKPYIVMHPFAGIRYRSCLPNPDNGQYGCYPDYKYVESANLLADTGYQVFIIGHTGAGKEPLRNYRESLDVSIPFNSNVHNMVNQLSLRLNVELTRKAVGFIGAHSSMLAAAWTANVPSVFFYPTRDENGIIKSVLKDGGETGTWKLDKPWNSYFELSPEEFLTMESEVPVNKLLELMQCESI